MIKKYCLVLKGVPIHIDYYYIYFREREEEEALDMARRTTSHQDDGARQREADRKAKEIERRKEQERRRREAVSCFPPCVSLIIHPLPDGEGGILFFFFIKLHTHYLTT